MAYPIAVDVSNNNGAVDFKEVKREGAIGAWLKVSEINRTHTYDDQYYVRNNQAARAAGLKVGGYFFGHPATDSVHAANHFLDLLRLHPGDFAPVLDLEVTDGCSAAQVHAWAQAFGLAVKKRVGEYPVLYAGSYFIKANALDTLPWKGLWIPSYGAAPKYFMWDAWQYTDGEARYGRSDDHLDTSSVRYEALITYKAPVVRRVSAAVLKGLTGFFAWREWRLGTGRFKGWGKSNPAVRPDVRHKIERKWWNRFKKLLP